MSEKAFGIKKIEIKGSGIPTLDSPTDLYLNAVNVSISTDVTIGRNINVSGISTLGAGVTVTGTTFTNQLSVSGIATIGPVATGTTSLYLGGPLKVGEIDISGGSNNVHVGQGAGRKNYNGGSGQQNTAVGWNALGVNQASNFNTAFGISALGSLGDTAFSNYDSNTAIGAYAGNSLLTGFQNTFVGRSAGSSITSGSSNTILGMYNGNSGGLDIRTSSNNVVLSDGSGNIKLYANSSGNVGLGTTNPTSKLSVNGGIQLAQNNATIVGTSGTVGEIKRIGGAPFFYDGSAWREFVLSAGTPVSVPADTEWDSVVFRATFDTDYTDAKFGATPIVVSAGSSIVGSAVTIGTGAYRNDNSFGNAGLTYPYRSEYDFTGSWTFETWIYFDNANETNIVSIFAITNGSDTSGQLALFVSTDIYANKSIQWANENGTNQVVYNTSGAAFYSIFNQKWVHIALVRESSNGSLHFYLNGVESNNTYLNAVIDNNIINVNNNQLNIGGTPNNGTITINGVSINTTGGSGTSIDAIYDDLRISAGVGTAGQRYTSIGTASTTTFTPPRTALPTTGTLSSYIQPPGDKYGEIGLGTSPTWRGTSGVTVLRQASGNYRVTFASSYTNKNDYYVLSQGMDQGFASYVGIARSTTHVDISINRLDNNATIDSGSLSVQIKNHI